MEAEVDTKQTIDHVIFLQHGLQGKSKDFEKVYASLKTLEKTTVFVSDLNWRWFQTQEGIDAQGNDLFLYVLSCLSSVKRNQEKKLMISFVGHSLGGLSSRYCIGLMERDGIFEKYNLDPYCYITVASPHLGVRPRLNVHGMQNGGFLSFLDYFKPMASFAGDTIETILSYGLIGETGRQMLLNDQKDIILRLSDPKDCFMKGLSRFAKRITVINHKSDVQVPFYTSAMMLNFERIPPAEASLSVLDFHKESSVSINECKSDMVVFLGPNIPEDVRQDKHFQKVVKISQNLNTLSWKRFHMELDGITSHLQVLKHPEVVSLIHSFVSPLH